MVHCSLSRLESLPLAVLNPTNLPLMPSPLRRQVGLLILTSTALRILLPSLPGYGKAPLSPVHSWRNFLGYISEGSFSVSLLPFRFPIPPLGGTDARPEANRSFSTHDTLPFSFCSMHLTPERRHSPRRFLLLIYADQSALSLIYLLEPVSFPVLLFCALPLPRFVHTPARLPEQL